MEWVWHYHSKNLNQEKFIRNDCEKVLKILKSHMVCKLKYSFLRQQFVDQWRYIVDTNKKHSFASRFVWQKVVDSTTDWSVEFGVEQGTNINIRIIAGWQRSDRICPIQQQKNAIFDQPPKKKASCHLGTTK